jgi:hypothetical protein
VKQDRPCDSFHVALKAVVTQDRPRDSHPGYQNPPLSHGSGEGLFHAAFKTAVTQDRPCDRAGWLWKAAMEKVMREHPVEGKMVRKTIMGRQVKLNVG